MKRICILLCLLLPVISIFSIDTSFDLSITPDTGGSTISARLSVDWNGDIQSSAYLHSAEFNQTDTQVENFGSAIMSTSSNQLQVDLLPLVIQQEFFSVPFIFSAGISYLGIQENQYALLEDENNVLVSNGDYVSLSNEREATIFSPRIGFSTTLNTLPFLQIRYSGYISPIYYLQLTQSIDYDFLETIPQNTVERWSYPYFEQSASLTIFENLRVAVYHSFQRLDFQTMDWKSDGSTMVGVDDVQTINVVKLGLEPLLSILDGTVRMKIGMYWQVDHISSSYWGLIQNDGSFLLSFGLES
ncbi:MAG: hypothetical protein ACLFR1_11985 [Spirochaetia bacterium]